MTVFNDWNEYDDFNRVNVAINGNFDGGLDGWSHSSTVTPYNGGARIQSTGGWAAMQQNILEIGKTYELTIQYIDSVHGSIAISIPNTPDMIVDEDATFFKVTFTATSETFRIRHQGPCDVTIDSISVYEI